MQTNLHMIGQLMEVRPNEYKNKEGKTIEQTEITVLFTGLSEDGYRKVSADTVLTDGHEDVDILRPLIGKYVCIPYVYSLTEFGGKAQVSCKVDRSMPVLTFEKNPLDYSKYERKASKA